MGNQCANCAALLNDNHELKNSVDGQSYHTVGNNPYMSQQQKNMSRSTNPNQQHTYGSNATTSQRGFSSQQQQQQQPFAQQQQSQIAQSQIAASNAYNNYDAPMSNIDGSVVRDDLVPLARHYFSLEETREIQQNQQNFALSNKREKGPIYRFQSGAVYEGEWLGAARDGFGVQTWPDGAKYEGDWVKNKACGKGRFQHVDGDIYEGEWREDKANGYGTYIHVNGAKYEGHWKDDLQHGHGLETWADGSKYEGFYCEGRKHGNGTYCWPDGSKYQGNWDDNKISGIGVYTWIDGRKYEGSWLDNNMHGRGIYTWRDGRKYDGEYQLDKKHGFGVYVWADGRSYSGDWRFGKQHGRGKYVQVDGQVRVGNWEDGKRTSWVEYNDPQYALSLRQIMDSEHIKLQFSSNQPLQQQQQGYHDTTQTHPHSILKQSPHSASTANMNMMNSNNGVIGGGAESDYYSQGIDRNGQIIMNANNVNSNSNSQVYRNENYSLPIGASNAAARQNHQPYSPGRSANNSPGRAQVPLEEKQYYNNRIQNSNINGGGAYNNGSNYANNGINGGNYNNNTQGQLGVSKHAVYQDDPMFGKTSNYQQGQHNQSGFNNSYGVNSNLNRSMNYQNSQQQSQLQSSYNQRPL